MIILSSQQLIQLKKVDPSAPDPGPEEKYVLISLQEYHRLMSLTRYDDSPWTDDEMSSLAVEAGDLLDRFGKE